MTLNFKNIENDKLVDIICSFEKSRPGEFCDADIIEIVVEDRNIVVKIDYHSDTYREISFMKRLADRDRTMYRLDSVEGNITGDVMKYALENM